ncbi:hypothetical protein MPC4_10366 [Methylocella tundrae]|uniref:Uncharacterized protein n=1 Tax=Methylocella tundrae TaxID=227605 RepID=A0A8B6M0R7_METTU|nr:hypothetical protein [Methylocella tundrae]VTZ20916.1 hypothetical protein MPC1_10020 [Methylocella tundrae]VTZ48416.1 hypothetical protein MPC4_10366 [Methylocella tundrae]
MHGLLIVRTQIVAHHTSDCTIQFVDPSCAPCKRADIPTSSCALKKLQINYRAA